MVAQDTSYNRSPLSEVMEITAEERVVDVTFTVVVPEYTTPTDTIYIAGGFQGWNPGGDPMTRLGDTIRAGGTADGRPPGGAAAPALPAPPPGGAARRVRRWRRA